MFHLEVGNPTSLKFLEELVGLERATFKKNDSWADGELEQMSKKRNSIIVAARLVPDGKLCGYVLCTSTGLNVHVSKIAVRAEYRRQGIAKRLMQAVLRTAATQRRSCSSTLHVALDNEPAVQLYRSLGYKEDGLLVSMCKVLAQDYLDGVVHVGKLLHVACEEDYYIPGRHAYKMICDLEPYKGAAEGGLALAAINGKK